MSAAKIAFHIKLLSGDNVVLVEANGFETELFMPQIWNGRIRLQNIIPNRRCCFMSHSQQQCNTKTTKVRSPLTSLNALPHMSAGLSERKTILSSSVSNKSRACGGEGQPRLPPLAYSTHRHVSTRNSTGGKENRNDMQFSNNYVSKNGYSANPTPYKKQTPQASSTPASVQKMRGKSLPTPYDVVKDTFAQIPSGIRIVRLYRNSISDSAQNGGRATGQRASKEITTDSSGFNLPSSPPSSILVNKNCDLNEKTAERLAPDSATKWRKCLTPLRTYSKRSSTLERRVSSQNLNKSFKQKVVPNYLAHPTQGMKGSHSVEVKKRKLVVDTKAAISPASFKKQIKSVNISTKTSSLPKSRKQYERNKMTAFEMLTNSNRADNMSQKLSDQFRKGCVNKTSSTNPKYKIVCTIPPISPDASNPESFQERSKNAHDKQTPAPASTVGTTGDERRTGKIVTIKVQKQCVTDAKKSS